MTVDDGTSQYMTLHQRRIIRPLASTSFKVCISLLAISAAAGKATVIMSYTDAQHLVAMARVCIDLRACISIDELYGSVLSAREDV